MYGTQTVITAITRTRTRVSLENPSFSSYPNIPKTHTHTLFLSFYLRREVWSQVLCQYSLPHLHFYTIPTPIQLPLPYPLNPDPDPSTPSNAALASPNLSIWQSPELRWNSLLKMALQSSFCRTIPLQTSWGSRRVMVVLMEEALRSYRLLWSATERSFLGPFCALFFRYIQFKMVFFFFNKK